MATSIYYQLANQSMAGQGVLAGNGNWRFVVRVGKVATDAVLGTMILGTDPLADITWIDASADVEWIDVDRGSTTAGSRIGAGQLTLRLSNDRDTYSAWRTVYNGPGTLIQIGTYQPTGSVTTPWFTGFTVSWNESQEGNAASRWIDIEALETTSLLTESNPAGISPIGAGEVYSARFGRIFTSARWVFNATDFGAGTYSINALSSPMSAWTFQATDLADDALTELNHAADSLGVYAIPARNGDVELSETRMRTATAADLGMNVPLVSDSIVTANDDEQLVGSYVVSRTGGTAQTYTNSGIAGRYQQRTEQGRFDIETQDPGSNADLSRIANDVLNRSKQVYRVQALQADSLHGSKVWDFLNALDNFYPVNVYKPDPLHDGTLFQNYAVCGYKLRIEPINQFAGLHVVADIETEPSQTATYSHVTNTSNTTGWDFDQWDSAVWAA